MRIVPGAVIAGVLAFSFIQPVAHAEPTPAPTASLLTPLEQYRIDRENYFIAMRAITQTFKASCDKARALYLTALSTAKNKDQKRAARMALESSIAAAAMAFENAKIELGAEPTEPARAPKISNKSKAKSR